MALWSSVRYNVKDIDALVKSSSLTFLRKNPSSISFLTQHLPKPIIRDYSDYDAELHRLGKGIVAFMTDLSYVAPWPECSITELERKRDLLTTREITTLLCKQLNMYSTEALYSHIAIYALESDMLGTLEAVKNQWSAWMESIRLTHKKSTKSRVSQNRDISYLEEYTLPVYVENDKAYCNVLSTLQSTVRPSPVQSVLPIDYKFPDSRSSAFWILAMSGGGIVECVLYYHALKKWAGVYRNDVVSGAALRATHPDLLSTTVAFLPGMADSLLLPAGDDPKPKRLGGIVRGYCFVCAYAAAVASCEGGLEMLLTLGESDQIWGQYLEAVLAREQDPAERERRALPPL